MVEFGFFALLLGLALSLYALATGIFGLFRPQLGTVISARNSLIGVNVCVMIASAVLIAGLVTHDFSIQYVFRNSSVDMPPMYLFTAFWSALEGSHTLWTLILTSVASVALLTVRSANHSLLPGLVTAFGVSHSFMLLLCVWASGPLGRHFPPGQFGNGMNALLQNPYMAAHPPSLFLGYCLLSVPFAYGIAVLLRGGFSSEWLITFRRWCMAAWIALSVGIFLGGKWAYVELGWSGYWAWDPVENSSFMPWLAVSAAIHSLLILDKTGRLPRLTVFLGCFGFILTFMGTFITRSGVISSVHSFAESNIGPAYLIYICLLLFFTLILLFGRGEQLQGAARANVWSWSKESGLLFTIFFLLFLLALIMIGTLLPIIVEAIRGVKISIQQPFFNAFAPWIAVALVSLLGIGNLVKWRSGKMEDPLVSIGFSAIWSFLITLALWHKKDLDIRSTIGFFLILWTSGTLLVDLVQRLNKLRFNGKVFWKYNRPYIGSLIAHLGFLTAIGGFLGGYRGLEVQTNLNLHQSVDFFGYQFKNQGLTFDQAYNYQLVKAKVEATDQKQNKILIEPIRSKYTNKEDWLNEIGIASFFWFDIYIVLASFDFKSQHIALNIHINPTVKLVWTSLVVMVIGGLIGLSHRIRKRSLEVGPQGLLSETATFSLESLVESGGYDKAFACTSLERNLGRGILTGLIGLSIFAWSGMALAQDPALISTPQSGSAEISSSKPAIEPLAKPELSQMDPALKAIGEELRCPTCTGISVFESNTPLSVAMKTEIENQLSQGKTKDEILSYFKEKYGEWILRKPDFGSSHGVWIWLIPIAGFIIGPVILLFFLQRSKKNSQAERELMKQEIRKFIASFPTVEKEGGKA
jgi:cytochrome c-type biogenesis protein CcmF